MPRSALTSRGKELARPSATGREHHVDAQRKLNLRALIDKAANDPQKLKDLRGSLAPFLRDTLVGFNYIHYAPPGAQVLHTNPLFVRSHDFIGIQGVNADLEGRPRCSAPAGRPTPADAWWARWQSLPYALAEAEQNFLIPIARTGSDLGRSGSADDPERGDPALVERDALAAALGGVHMAYAETLLAESALDADAPRSR